MLHAGLDLSRRKVDVCLLSTQGEIVDEWASPPDGDGLRGLAARAAMWGPAVRGVIESMNGARFVHDRLEEHGWDVLIADATKVKGLAPLACKTDKIDARVLATLSARDLVPEIWLPDPSIRRERELARFRLHLVRHRTTLKNRIHAALIAFGHPCPVSDLFGHAGRELLDRLEVPDPWRQNIDVSLGLIDDLELQIAALTVQLKRQGAEQFSTRRRQIEERQRELVNAGVEVRRAGREAIAHDTRERKRYGVDTAPWQEVVRARAAEHGLGARELEALTRGPAQGPEVPDLAAGGRRARRRGRADRKAEHIRDTRGGDGLGGRSQPRSRGRGGRARRNALPRARRRAPRARPK